MDNEKSKEKGNSKNLMTIVAVAVVVVALGFFGGMQYQKSKSPSFEPGQFQNGMVRRDGTATRNGDFQGARPVNGEIVSIDENTLTVKIQDGSSKIVILSDSTVINKTSDGSKEDLKEGEQIMVIGTEGVDGTVTAQNISIGGRYLQGTPGIQ